MRGFYLFLMCILLCAGRLNAQNFPFPVNAGYKYGIQPDTVDAAKIQSFYAYWKKTFYEENSDHSLARVRFDELGRTVSEGIAYGMVICVYMDNATNNTHPMFDKLWAYYKKYSNSPGGMMAWNVSGFNGAIDANSASDADIEVAFTLMMADKQWGSTGSVNYLSEAKTLIGKIWNKEIHNNGDLAVTPSDGWDGKTNPSYFLNAAFRVFKYVDSHNWDGVIAKGYQLIKASRNSTTGLMPDWCSYGGGAYDDFHYDAVRTPWRMAMTYAWFGDADAYEICDKIATWVRAKYSDSWGKDYNDENHVISSYKLDGTPRSTTNLYGDPTFHGAFLTAGMVDAKHQKWVNDGYRMITYGGYDTITYFNACLRVMYTLFATGNMPNFWDMGVSYKTGQTNTAGTQIELSFSGNLNPTTLSAIGEGFAVMVNGVSKAVASASLQSGNNKVLILKLQTALSPDDIDIYVNYTPGTLKAQDGSKVPAMTNLLVTNTMPGRAVRAVSVQTSTDGKTIDVIFEREMAAPTATAPAELVVVTNGYAVTTSAIALKQGTTNTYTITLATALSVTDKITLSYIPGFQKASDGGNLKAFSGLSVANMVTTTGLTGFYEDFNDNIKTAWYDAATGNYTMTEENQQFTVLGSTSGYNYFYRLFAESDISANPVATIRVKSATALTVRIDLIQKIGDIYYKTNSQGISFAVAGDNAWHTLTFDFTGKFTAGYDDNGKAISVAMDPKKICGAGIYINPGNNFSTTAYFDDLKVGTVPAPVAVSSISLSSTMNLTVGASRYAYAQVLPANASDKTLTWSSANPAIASVDANGRITGVSAGTAVVTAKNTASGKTADVTVTVTEETVAQFITLAAGWNLISFNIQLLPNTVADVFGSTLTSIEEIKDNESFYRTGQTTALNSLQSIEGGKAYLIKATASAQLTIKGVPLRVAATPISLKAGWNLLGYIPQTAKSTDAALLGVQSQLGVIKDMNSYYKTGDPLNSLTELKPGAGYFIKMNAAAVLTYP